MMLLLLLHTYRPGGAFGSTYAAAFAVTVINVGFITIDNCFRAIYPTQLALVAKLDIDHWTVGSPGSSVTTSSLHGPGNRPVSFGN